MVKHLLNLPVWCLWEKTLLIRKQKLLSQKMTSKSKNLQKPKVLLRKGKRPKPKKELCKIH